MVLSQTKKTGKEKHQHPSQINAFLCVCFMTMKFVACVPLSRWKPEITAKHVQLVGLQWLQSANVIWSRTTLQLAIRTLVTLRCVSTEALLEPLYSELPQIHTRSENNAHLPLCVAVHLRDSSNTRVRFVFSSRWSFITDAISWASP